MGWQSIPGASQVVLVVKNLFANAGDATDMGWIPALGRSFPVGNSILLQYSFLKNSMDRGARWAIVHSVTKSQTKLSAHRTSSRKYSLKRMGSIQTDSRFSIVFLERSPVCLFAIVYGCFCPASVAFSHCNGNHVARKS